MGTKLNPYLNFRDNTRQAMEFYKTVFGGNLASVALVAMIDLTIVITQ